jgi:BirA family transcriptional regulator, biotin operon repressor / biotin---[acetyl-CoA-carboxylase] ligase
MGDLIGLAEVLESAIAREKLPWFDRASVIRQTATTQDFAKAMAAGRPGLVVIAGRQTQGRGRLGRRWADTKGQGLAATFVIGGDARSPEHLAIAAGLGACMAAESAVGGGGLGLRWPNDVVERRPDGSAGRKLAGVLVERFESLALIGIGLNVLQTADDWAPEMNEKATSLRELGSSMGRPEAAEALMVALSRCISMGAEELAAAWSTRDVLIGSTCTFEHDARRHTGIVEAIHPTSHLKVRLDDGTAVLLPALTTSMVQGG